MRHTQWAPTAPDARWVPTVLMVEEHADLAWRQIRTQAPYRPPQPGPRRIQAPRVGETVLLALVSFAAGALVTLAARGVWL
jgi:hypothetical protein